MIQMQAGDALDELRDHAIADKSADMAAYHKVDRPYLGVANPVLNELTKTWRQSLDLDARLKLASDLWATNIHEARVCAAKLLTQARIRPDDNVAWQLIVSWVPDFDAWAIADHVAMAGQRRLTAEPTRLGLVETWTRSDHMWTRRAALTMTLPWTKNRNPKPGEMAQREIILGWAATYATDPDWFIQKAVAWWLRDLSKRDPERVKRFLSEYGDDMKPFARREAAKYL